MSRRLELTGLVTVGLLPPMLNGFYNDLLANDRPGFWTLDIAAFVGLTAALYLWGIRRKLFTNEALGFTVAIGPWRSAAVVVGVSVLVTPFMIWADAGVVAWAMQHLTRSSWESSFRYKDMLPLPGPSTGLWRLLGVLYLGISAGFSEEFLVRGVMRELFGRRWWQVIAYVVVSTTLFAAIHWENGMRGMAETVLFGLIAAVFASATRNIWPLVVAHAAVDIGWFGT